VGHQRGNANVLGLGERIEVVGDQNTHGNERSRICDEARDRACWRNAPGGAGSAASDEWFTVRIAQAIFRLTPSHRAIKLASEALILLTVAGVGFRGVAGHRQRVARGSLPSGHFAP
jgi:hypothetical protein